MSRRLPAHVLGGSRRRGRPASWLAYASVLVHADRIEKIKVLLRQLPAIRPPDPDWKRKTWKRIEAAIAADRLARG